ncbi:TPA: hypothetical protein U1C31_000749 [Streptococcus suis]|nr:hypothetical protein [Streptococcus suis]
MTKKNQLLEDEITQQIQEARYVEPKPDKKRRGLFYKTIIFLVTLAILYYVDSREGLSLKEVYQTSFLNIQNLQIFLEN